MDLVSSHYDSAIEGTFNKSNKPHYKQIKYGTPLSHFYAFHYANWATQPGVVTLQIIVYAQCRDVSCASSHGLLFFGIFLKQLQYSSSNLAVCLSNRPKCSHTIIFEVQWFWMLWSSWCCLFTPCYCLMRYSARAVSATMERWIVGLLKNTRKGEQKK